MNEHDLPPDRPARLLFDHHRGTENERDFFPNTPSGFPSAAHMVESRLWFEEGKSQALELRFACSAQLVEHLCIVTAFGYVLFKQIEMIRGRSVFSAIAVTAEPPPIPHQSIAWIDAGGPLSEAPQAVREGDSSHD